MKEELFYKETKMLELKNIRKTYVSGDKNEKYNNCNWKSNIK